MAEEKSDDFPTEEEIAKEKKTAEEANEKKEEEGKKKKEPDEKEPEKKEEEKEPEIEEPEVRKSAKDYIIERKQKKIEKLENKETEEKEPENLYNSEEELTPEGRKAIDKGIDKATSPILKTLKTQSDEQELSEVFKNHSGAKKMEKQIRKYMEHSAYKSASVEFIYLALAAKRDRFQVKKDEANTEAKKNKTGGHSRRKLDEGKLPDFKGMSDKEFDEFDTKFRTGQIQV